MNKPIPAPFCLDSFTSVFSTYIGWAFCFHVDFHFFHFSMSSAVGLPRFFFGSSFSVSSGCCMSILSVIAASTSLPVSSSCSFIVSSATPASGVGSTTTSCGFVAIAVSTAFFAFRFSALASLFAFASSLFFASAFSTASFISFSFRFFAAFAASSFSSTWPSVLPVTRCFFFLPAAISPGFFLFFSISSSYSNDGKYSCMNFSRVTSFFFFTSL